MDCRNVSANSKTSDTYTSVFVLLDVCNPPRRRYLSSPVNASYVVAMELFGDDTSPIAVCAPRCGFKPPSARACIAAAFFAHSPLLSPLADCDDCYFNLGLYAMVGMDFEWQEDLVMKEASAVVGASVDGKVMINAAARIDAGFDGVVYEIVPEKQLAEIKFFIGPVPVR